MTKKIEIGMRIHAGEGEDYDTGTVQSIEGAMATASWDTLTVTCCPLEMLRPL
jgi:hypothetical protein